MFGGFGSFGEFLFGRMDVVSLDFSRLIFFQFPEISF